MMTRKSYAAAPASLSGARRAKTAKQQPQHVAPATLDRMLTVAQVMDLIGFGETMTRALVRGGAFGEPLRYGRSYRIAESGVLAWRQEHTRQSA